MPGKDLAYPNEVRDAAVEWRLLIESGAMTPEERAEFEAWRAADRRHSEAYDRADTVWAAFGALSRDTVHERHFKQSWPGRVRTVTARLCGAWQAHAFAKGGIVAAIALTLFGVVILPQVLQTSPGELAETPLLSSYATKIGETKAITLSDGTLVTLGAASGIEVAMSSSERVITLAQGAALFDVAHDQGRPFSVKAEGFTARVLGTVFDVRNNGGVVRLSVADGVVAASHPLIINGAPSSMVSQREVTAGQKLHATSADGLSTVETFREDSFAAWREDRLKYEAATLSELVADANRYSETPIEIGPALQNLANVKVTVSFLGNDIDGMLTTLADIFPVEIDRSSDSVVVIRGRPD